MTIFLTALNNFVTFLSCLVPNESMQRLVTMVKEQQEAWKERQTKLGNVTRLNSFTQRPGHGSVGGAGQTSLESVAKKSNPTIHSKSSDHRTKQANFRDSHETGVGEPVSAYSFVPR